MSVKKAQTAREYRYIPIPEEFLDVMGEPWATPTDPNLGLTRVLTISIRRSPSKSNEEAERAYDVVKAILAAELEDAEYITLLKEDYEWVIAVLKAHAHTIWSGPDAVRLRKYIEEVVVSKLPTDSGSGDDETPPTA